MSGTTSSRGYEYPEAGDIQSGFPAINRQAMEKVDADMGSALAGLSSASSRISALEGTLGPLVRVDNTAGKAIYLKAGGAEHLISYDSGWRNIWSLVDPQVLVPAQTQPRMLVRRTERGVTFVIRAHPGPLMVGDIRTRTRNFISALPIGFRNTPLVAGTVGTLYLDGVQIDLSNSSGGGYLGIRGASGSWAASDSISTVVQYPCSETLPTTLPGTPE